ncbi:MAG: EH signature domain-containing protein [Candidatus Gastranaerophilales bacterium]|nr:EH signature domain-containing protein [Candidatus Gastranaerophilales bacterium]
MANSFTEVLNKLKSINEAFGAAPFLGDFELNKNNEKIYKFKIQSIIDKPLEIFPSIDKSKRERALSNWKNYLETGNKSIFSSRDFNILVFEPNVIIQKEFLDLVKTVEKLSSKTIKGLVYGYQELWTEHIFYDEFQSLLLNLFKKLETKNSILNLWKQNVHKIILSNAPQTLAAEIVENNLDLNILNTNYYLDAKNSRFSEEVYKYIIFSKVEAIKQTGNINIESIEWFKKILRTYNFSKQERSYILSVLISTTEKTHSKDKNEFKTLLKDFILEDIDFKDPRHNKEKWSEFEKEKSEYNWLARKIFIKWLSEEDIELFFDWLIDHDPHGRKNFWLQYAGIIENSVMVVGNETYNNYEYREKLSKLRASGRNYIRLNDLTNAFILEIKGLTIVEFSKEGNACYIYDKNKFQSVIKYKNNYLRDELKDKLIVQERVSHYPGWQSKLRNWFAVRGIRP